MATTNGDDPQGPALPQGPLGDVLQDALQKFVHEGRDRILRAADDSRALLRVRQLQRDREAMWTRLGKIAYRLTEAGEVDHPALRKAVDHVDALDREIASLGGPAEPDDTEG